LKYPYEWGRGIVNDFVERHARGTMNAADLLDVSPGIIRHWLVLALCQGHNLKFRAYKSTIKLLDDYGPDDLKGLSREDRKVLYRYVAFLGDDDALDEKSFEITHLRY